MEKVILTRLQLYELVWQQPVQKLAITLGISDVGLAKTCRRLGIPLPGRGYWAKLAAGHKLSKIPLTDTPNAASEISFVKTVKPQRSIKVPALEETDAPTIPPWTLSNLDTPHPFVKRWLKDFKHKEVDQYGLRQVWPALGCSIRVSPTVERRALAIIDTLLSAVKKAGLKIEIQEKQQERYPTYINQQPFAIANEIFKFTIRESFRQQRKTEEEVKREKAEGKMWIGKMNYFPIGKLTFTIDNYPRGYVATWSDGTVKVESMLNDIFQAILAFPRLIEKQKKHEQEAKKIADEQALKQWKIQQEVARKNEYRQELLKEAIAFHEYELLRSYLNNIEKRFSQTLGVASHEVIAGFNEKMAEAKDLALNLDHSARRLKKMSFPAVTIKDAKEK